MKRSWCFRGKILCIFFILCSNLLSAQYINRNIKIQKPDKSAIMLINKSSQTSEITLYLNDKAWYSLGDICAYIRKMPPIRENEPIEEKAWRFVVLHSRHGNTFKKQNWLHHPNIFLKSIGWGICDDMAAVLATIWRTLGYSSRICHLSGHAVPEVKINGKWRMYDPNTDVYFVKNGEVLGVSDLSKDPNIITSPDSVVGNVLNFRTCGKYNLTYSRMYSQKSKHSFVYNWEYGKSSTTLTLPPNAVFQFPGRYWNKNNLSSKLYDKYAAAGLLKIHGRYSGTIKLPFYPVQISGKGKIIINGENYLIGSAELNKKLASANENITNIVVVEGRKIEIVVLMNPKVFVLNSNNSINIRGKNLSEIELKAIKLKRKFRLNEFVEYPVCSSDLIKNHEVQFSDTIIISRILEELNIDKEMFGISDLSDLSKLRKNITIRLVSLLISSLNENELEKLIEFEFNKDT
jgi:hypothetical protein